MSYQRLFFLVCFWTSINLIGSIKPLGKRVQATWRLECELGIISEPDCPIDGGWSPWAPWSACRGACDSVGHRKRVRKCNNPLPSKDGVPCCGLDEQIESCYLNNCTIDDYRKLIEGNIPRTQAFNELKAMPVLMDRCFEIECSFEAVEVALRIENTWQLNSESLWNALQCVKHDLGCPLTGEWGTWSKWSACGARCGKGQRWRTRQCDTPPPSIARLVCAGAPLQCEECQGEQCAIDGEYTESISGIWSEWGKWSECSEKCGAGIRRRKRNCLEKHISISSITWGTHCRGQYDQLEVCRNKKCLLHGGWFSWGPWGPCSQTCGAGKRSRTRSCTRPIPSINGTSCVGSKVEIGSCHLIPCVVYTHMIGIFKGDSFLQYYFPQKRSRFFHFFIRFMPLSPHGTLIRRGTSQDPHIRLSIHKWHVCLDARGSLKSCNIPRMCSPSALEPALWHTLVITISNEAATIRLNDAQDSFRSSFPCDPKLTNDIMNIYIGERLHGEVQEVILNFIPLCMTIERERKAERNYFFPSAASNMAYEKANAEEAYLNIQKGQYLRVPCFQEQTEWQIELTIKSKQEDGTIIFLPTSKYNSWFYMTLQSMRIKIKFTNDDFKSEATSYTECLPDEWLDITIVKKKETNTIQVSINAGERLHVLLKEDFRGYRQYNKNLRSCSNLNNEGIANHSVKSDNYSKQKEICNDEFFVGGTPKDIQNRILEDLSPFSGIIASLRVSNELIDLHDCTIERDRGGEVQVSSRTASISGSYHETGWGETNSLNLTCLYARNGKLSHGAYWLYLDTVLQFNKYARAFDDGKILRLILTSSNNQIGFYTCRVPGNRRTRNLITYAVLGKIHYKLIGPDTITVIAVCTTISLIIFTLVWLILEGYHDIRHGYGFYRDAQLRPEEEAEIVCKYIDQNMHHIGSESAVNLAKANTRRRGRRLASRASLGAQQPEATLKNGNEKKALFDLCTQSDPDESPARLESESLCIEPSHEIYRCVPTYVSSPRHGSNITSFKKTSSSTVNISPRFHSSRLVMTESKNSSKARFTKKDTNRSGNFSTRGKYGLLTIKSSTIVNKSPVQKVLQKFQELKSDDS